MSFFDTHLEGCTPASPCAKCKLHSLIAKIEQGQFRGMILEQIELAFKGELPSSEEVPENTDLETPIESLGFSTRVRLCLTRDNILTLGDLLKLTRENIIQIPNFGKHSLKEVDEFLASKGLCLPSKKA